MVNLETSDLKAAQRLRDRLDRETAENFAAILSGENVVSAGMTAREQGLLHRETLEAAMELDTGEPEGNPADVVRWATEDTVDSFRNEADRDAFLDALHHRDAADAHLEKYLLAANLAAKTRNEHKGNIGRFIKWSANQRPALTLDRIDRKQAGKYVSEIIDQMHPATQKKHLSALRGYWRWLAARGHVELPMGAIKDSGWPWDGQQVQRNGKRVERGSREGERPFTDVEIQTLIGGPYPVGISPDYEVQIRDALRIALLSGLRMAEILTLLVEEVRTGTDGAGLVFDIQQGKTAAAARPVPVHPDLMEIVARRLKGKASSAWLFDELSGERDPGDTFGKRFHRYRLALKVDDQREGKRRSLVNFHSARRWFATCADRAGQPEAVIKDVIGHAPDKKNVTRSYISRSSGAQMRGCVEAVRLPSLIWGAE